MQITDITITPIAFADPPLLNSTGVHEPLALRTIVQIHTDDGEVGLGECGGEATVIDRLRQVAPHLSGRSIHDTGAIEADLATWLPGLTPLQRRQVFAPLEVALLDLQGKAAGVPVCDLLGGKVRDKVAYSAYLFYKWAEHPALDGRSAIADPWGPAMDTEGLIAQAHTMIEKYGFGSIKLKGGVFPPEIEIETIRALATEFPGLPLRIDPNVAWSVPTSIAVAEELAGTLEYLEDPTAGRPAMAEVAHQASMPLATNMCVVAFEDIPEAIRLGSVQVVLADHHYWGGLRHTRDLGAICETFGLGMSMHSNSHLGITLAAMTQVAAAIPTLSYACDTHYPWSAADDVLVAPPRIVDGAITVSDAPGLGVEIDPDRLERLAENYRRAGRTHRNDTGYRRRIESAYDPSLPRW